MSKFILKDLYETYDEELLRFFHQNVMREFFPVEDELGRVNFTQGSRLLDPVEEWIDALRPRSIDEPQRPRIKPELHVVVVFDQAKYGQVGPYKSIAGGMVFEYYKMSNCGLLSYFVVCKDYRGMSLGELLVKEAYARCSLIAEQFLEQDAKKLSEFRSSVVLESLQQCLQTNSSAAADFSIQFLSMLLPFLFKHDKKYKKFFTFFAETNVLALDDGVLDSKIRHKIMHKLGFRMLDFDYIQPPLSAELQPCPDLLLLVLDNSTIPVSKKSKRKFVPTITPMLFLLDFAYSISHCTSVKSFIEQPYFKHVMTDLSKRGSKLYLHDLPWTRRTNFEVTNTSKL